MLKKWYGCNSKEFPDGTKMRLIPPFQSLITFGQKAKYASLVAGQAAINSSLCTGLTWKLTANLVLDKPDPENGFTLRQLILNISSRAFPNKPLFHTVDRLWGRNQELLLLSYLKMRKMPDHTSLGSFPSLRKLLALGLCISFLRMQKLDTSNNKTRQAYSAEEVELEALLADDDEMNKSDEPTLSKPMGHVDVNIPDVSEMETSSILYNDNDLVSTFNSGIKSRRSTQPSLSFTLRIILPTKPIPLKKNTTIDVDLTDHDSISKISDTESRLSSREERFATFSTSLNEMKAQAKLEAQQNAKALADIMAMLRNPSTAQPSQCDPPGQNVTADKANPLTLDRR